MLVPGEIVDHFQVARPIGRGGMGEVFLARDVNLGRRVALKVVNPRHLGSPDMVERFLHEARITAQFSHPHIVTVYAAGIYRGFPYLALEYLEGQSLRQRMREDRPGLRDSLRIALAIAEALREAHGHGVLHRDLKPENVLIPRDGRLRVVDFGLAKQIVDTDLNADLDAGITVPFAPSAPAAASAPPFFAEPSAPAVPAIETTAANASGDTVVDRATETAVAAVPVDAVAALGSIATGAERIVGTPRYMAPEQWQGAPCTGATDVWALGLMLYELIAGKLPYHKPSSIALAIQVIAPEPVPPLPPTAEVPDELAALVMRCLEKIPARRPSAAEIASALDEMISQRRARPEIEQGPFRGLLPFGERHADFFFGRDAEVASFLERLREQPVLPVVGHSGAGKSSFMQAGIIARLREQGPWMVLQLRPGDRPFATLANRLFIGESATRGSSPGSARTIDLRHRADADAATSVGDQNDEQTDSGDDVLDEKALARALFEQPSTLALRLQRIAELENTHVLLYIDQLEELCTLVDDDQVRQRFMQAICTAADDPAGPVRVTFTLRDDFLSRLASSAEARAALGQLTVLRSPEPGALREILVRPLQAVGFGYDDPALVDEMVAAVRGEPACLPLLQFAAQLLWDRRDREHKLLRRAAYAECGGVGGALAVHADGVLAGLSSEHLRTARELLLRLVTSERTRRLLSRSQALDGLGAAGDEVLARLTQARLISVRRSSRDEGAETSLELVHESLIHAWGRLARWIDESREQISFLTDVGQAAEAWQRRGERSEELLRGQALRDAQRALERYRASTPALVQRFVDASERLAKRAARRRRLAVAVLALVAITAVTLAIAFADQRSKAQHRSEELRVQWANAQREGARAALGRGDLIEARAKVRSSLESQDSTLGRALWLQLQSDPLAWRKKLETTVNDVAFSPDAATVAGACQDKTVVLVDSATSATRVLRGFSDQLLTVAFAPAGRQLAVGAWNGEIQLAGLDDATHSTLHGHTDAVWSVAFRADGKQLASSSADGTIRLWDAAGGALQQTLTDHSGSVESVAYRSDGTLLASAGTDMTVRLWAITDSGARPTRVLRGHSREVAAVAFSHDGSWLASASYDATVRIWDVASGAEQRVLRGHRRGVRDLAFTPDDRRLVTSSIDGTLRVWDSATGALLQTLEGHGGAVVSVGISADGNRVVSGGEDNTIRIWDLTTRTQPRANHGHTAAATGVAFTPDGQRLASAGYDKNIIVWNVATGAPELTLVGHSDTVFDVSFSPDGNLLASGSYDKTIRLWDATTGSEKKALTGHGAMVSSVTFAPDGRTLASGGYDNTVRLWDVAAGRERRTLAGHSGWVTSVAFDGSGHQLASASFDETIRIWDVTRGTTQRILRGHSGEIYAVAFSPDGKRLVSGGADQQLRLWDVGRGSSRVIGSHGARIYRVAFDPSGRRVGSAAADGSARITDLASGAALELRGHGGEINGIAFERGGRWAATSSDDGTVQVWDATTGHPFWRGSVLAGSPPQLLTHRGWLELAAGPGATVAPSRRWQAAVAADAQYAAAAADGTTLCVRTAGQTIALWDLAGDALVQSVPFTGARDLVALPGACAIGGRDQVTLVDRTSTRQLSSEPATAIAADGSALLIAAGTQVIAHDLATDRRVEYAVVPGATALARTPDLLLLGYADGNIESISLPPRPPRPAFSFEAAPSSAVVRLLIGPRSTLIAGYANGWVGIWDLETGTLYQGAKLHGRVVHLVRDGSHLYAATELGDALALDLGLLEQDYCALLAGIWRSVPMVWERGQPLLQPPPVDHRCAVARGAAN